MSQIMYFNLPNLDWILEKINAKKIPPTILKM